MGHHRTFKKLGLKSPNLIPLMTNLFCAMEVEEKVDGGKGREGTEGRVRVVRVQEHHVEHTAYTLHNPMTCRSPVLRNARTRGKSARPRSRLSDGDEPCAETGTALSVANRSTTRFSRAS